MNIIRECEWNRIKRDIPRDFVTTSKFLFAKSITSEDILTAVQNSRFFGIMKVDVESPESVIEEYGHLNFPFIFKEVQVNLQMLSPEMQRQVAEKKKKLPATYKTLCWNATGIVLTSPLIQFYQDLGMNVKNVEWAIEYYEGKPFTKFVNKLVDVRIRVKIILTNYS